MKCKFILCFVFLVLLIGLVSAQATASFLGGTGGEFSSGGSYSSFNAQYFNPGFTGSSVGIGGYGYYGISPKEYRETCRERQDFVVQIAPGGCTPAVVRSDLLAEQNVPVFCQLQAIQINPTIDVSKIRSISLTQVNQRDENVAGVAYHLPNIALHTRPNVEGLPALNNIGYAVIVLKMHPDERTLPENVSGDLTARIRYETPEGFGLGLTEKLIPIMSDDDWQIRYKEFGFFEGAGYLRVEEINGENVKIGIYTGDNRKYDSFTITKGQPSSEYYLPGFFCNAAYTVNLVELVKPEPKATIEIDSDSYDVYNKQSNFAEGFNCRVSSISAKEDGTGHVSLSCNGKPVTLALGLKTEISETEDSESDADNSFEEANKIYKEIASDYGDISFDENYENTVYGKKALTDDIELARDLGKQKTALDLIQFYKQNYGEYPSGVEELLTNYNFSKASTSIEIDGIIHNIRLVNLELPTPEEKSVVVTVDGGTQTLIENGAYIIGPTDDNGKLSIQLDGFDEDKISVTGKCPDKESPDKETIAIHGKKTICGKEILVQDIKLQKEARIKLTPVNRNLGSIVNFSYAVGIEKRAIELTPEKAEARIAKLNETIEKWERISDSLTDVVKTMKAACFTTSAVLQVKNLFSNLGGEAIARTQAMEKWHDLCSQALASEGKQPVAGFSMKGNSYSDLDDCFMQNAGEIKKDVDFLKNQIKSSNEEIKKIEEPRTTSSGIFGTKTVSSKAKKDYINNVLLKNTLNGNIADPEEKRSDINLNVLEYLREHPDSVSYDNAVEINSWIDVSQNGNERLKALADKKLYTLLSDVEDSKKLDEVKNRAEEIGKTLNVNGELSTTLPTLRLGESPAVYKGATLNEKPVQHIVTSDGDEYLVELERQSDGRYTYGDIYEINDKNQKEVRVTDFAEANKIKSQLPAYLIKIDSSSYENTYLKPEVRYYETEPYKGMPAVVPVDLKKGWYAGTRQTLPTFGNIKAFQDSGRVSSFWLCNVGANGREEFDSGIGDDLCQQFNLDTGQSLGEFYGLSDKETKTLVNKAVNLLEDAASKYKSGIKTVSLSGVGKVNVGNPAPNIPGTNCADFMSPTDCKILFNVCDPVLCPSSRCNLGGKYYVDDVVQTGIVGGIFMCLPNYKEVAVPVCLTGIQAGIDNYVSIMKASQQCLQEAVDTGVYTGICDEITAIYQCEFFWRQISPIINVILPKLLEKATGQGIRGGGEYLGVQAAWENMQNSISYFKNIYAVNSLKAFQIRSTQEAGTEVCKSFVSVRYPNKFNILIEPDSPSQFTAWFDEIQQSDATIPPISHYKVFYHIFAGEDRGAYYSVYLRDATGSSFYSSTGNLIFATGFINKGEYASETLDRTAPSGFKQICIRINEQEERGFKQVSTDFALNYVRDKYVQGQIENVKITKEGECISGTSNILGAVNPNIQAGVEDAVNPALYERGVIRVCATNNPGEPADSTRWQDVGYCTDTKIRCWLDKDSVSESFSAGHVGIYDETIDNLNKIAEDKIKAEGDKDFAAPDSAGEDELFKNIEKQTDIKQLESIRDTHILTELQTAKLLYKMATIYAEKAREEFTAQKAQELSTTIKETPSTFKKEDCESGCFLEGSGCFTKEEYDENTCKSIGGEWKGGKDETQVEETPEIKIEVSGDIYSESEVLSAIRNANFINNNCAQYAGLISSLSQQEGVDALLVTAVMQKESDCDKDADSGKENEISFGDGASYGLMQISGKSWCGQYELSEDEEDCISQLKNPQTNIKIGIKILKSKYSISSKLYKCAAFESNKQNEPAINEFYTGWDYALRAYNGWGCAGYRSNGKEIFADQDYVEKVKEIYDSLVLAADTD